MSKPFNIGDVVFCKSESFNGINIIMKCERCQGDWKYESHRGAWLHHSDLKLIKKNNDKTANAAGKLYDLQNKYESNPHWRIGKKIDKLESDIINGVYSK